MNIHTAAKYMSHGYRVKRADWDSRTYLYVEYNGVIRCKTRVLHPDPSPDTYENADWCPRHHDMVADDWELILEGVIEGFPVTYGQ